MIGGLTGLVARIRAWFHARRTAAELDQEVETHLSLLAEEFERQGASPEDAARRARLAFGGVTQFKEDQRDRRGLPALDALVQDIRYGARVFAREPAFTAGAILTLALGLGANTGVFSLLNGFLRPLPVPGASDIVAIGGETRGDENALRHTVAFPTVTDLRAHNLPLTDLFAYTPWIAGLQAGGRVTTFVLSGVTDNFFTGLRLEPALGRLIAPGDGEHPGTPRVVVLGYSCWQRRFGGDPNVLNTMVRINGQAATVIGVVPKTFLGLYPGTEMDGYVTVDTVAALDFSRYTNLFADRQERLFLVYGRLQPGVTPARAQEAVEAAARDIEREHPDTDRNRTLRVFPERWARPFANRALVQVVPVISAFILALAALVLGLACMNVSNLLFVRALGREREMAVRAAIGASRARLIRQSLTESLMLAVAGGLVGLGFALVGRRLFIAGIDIGSDFTFAVNFDFDWRVFLYAFAVVTAAGVIVGLWPALKASRANASAMLHDGGRSQSGGASGQRLRRLLVVAQVAGALMLLTVAGLFVRHLLSVQHLDLGFDAAHVLNARLDPHQVGYDNARAKTFYTELERRIRLWPEVESVSTAFSAPLGYFSEGTPVVVDGRPLPPGEPAPLVNFNHVDSDYFRTMQIPLLEGRAFRDADDRTDAHVVIVNRTMADRFWPGRSAIGQTIRMGKPEAPPLQVVGVVRDSKYVFIFEETRPYLYIPIGQSEMSMRVLQTRTRVPPATLGVRLEREIRALDPDMPIADLQTMQASLSGAMGFFLYRLGVYQAAALGVLGLLLAIVGVYGVVSHGASQRTREIGIRVALGANPRDIARLILRQGAALVAAGVVLGTAGAALASRVMEQFFTVTKTPSAPTVIEVSSILAAIALVACYLPARRAMRVDPVVALRHE